MRDLKKEGLTKADDEALYHHPENPEGEPLNSKQDDIFDEKGVPLLEENEELYKEASEGGTPLENYVHRVVKGKGGMLDRIAQGTKSVGAKNTLSKNAPQTKHRTYFALEKTGGGQSTHEDDVAPGTRRIVSVKGGQVTAWDHGTPENLGGISHTHEGRVFEDKDGNIWTLQQGDHQRIEQHTETQYYHSFFVSTIAANIQLNSAVRATRFLNAFKASPEFKEIAWQKDDGGAAPTGWQPTIEPHFSGYYFEPRTAEVLDKYATRMKVEGPIEHLFTSVGSFLRTSMCLPDHAHFSLTEASVLDRHAEEYVFVLLVIGGMYLGEV